MEKETSEIVCILMNKAREEFIAIIDEDEGYAEFRVNDKKPFGYPLEQIKEGYVFVVTTEIVPGTMMCRVDEGDIFRYTKILSNKKLIEYMEEWDEFNADILHKKVEELRNGKIETIIQNEV